MVCGGIVADGSSLKRSSRWLFSGIAVTLVGFGIQQTGIQFARHFNYNDLFHLTQIGAFLCLYRLAAGLERNSG